MTTTQRTRATMTVAAIIALTAPIVTPAAAQSYDPRYDGQYQSPPPDGYPGTGYRPNGPNPDSGYNGAYDPNYDRYAPPGYDGRSPPPPPPGWSGYNGDWQVRDSRYAYAAEDWARRYCVRSEGNAAAGAIIGGLLGAIIGSGFSHRYDRGSGIIAGAAVGAVGGAVIGASADGSTSPGCPPGYVVRRGSVSFIYSDPGYYYAAPGWYRPWIFMGGDWRYRPYPYHAYYYRYYWSREHGGWHDGGGYGWRGDGWRGRDRDDWRDGDSWHERH